MSFVELCVLLGAVALAAALILFLPAPKDETWPPR